MLCPAFFERKHSDEASKRLCGRYREWETLRTHAAACAEVPF